ncbi:hypothetical protein MLD38_034665 [Melastoma candidum]|uniref:Uncharacterized protein n=1 Tax=Melastoma candidum TaxID=119954 RepID=A0ACB9MCJ9_9MYRT|nr:hypothetical protein MLD38_034665 [Melastoma candidum]
MAAANIPQKSLAMNGGDGVYSYSRNSFMQVIRFGSFFSFMSRGSIRDESSDMQKKGLDNARTTMAKGILEKLDVKRLLENSHSFVIADLGCSVGPNTFFVVQNIVENVIEKCSRCGIDIEGFEFQAFLNDRASNDFNMLFRLLPSDKPYHVAAVPGSFHGRLFPKASVHLFHSSYSIQWLSQVPSQVQDETSPAWNRGRIYMVDAPMAVTEAYRKQYAKDMEEFLDARAAELVSDGLMALLLPIAPTSSKCMFYGMVQLLESVFTEFITAGSVSEAMLDSFNVPYYSPTSAELEAAVARDGRFIIENIERFERPNLERSQGKIDAIIMHLRAGWEGVIKAHFGDDIIEPLFERFKEKVSESFLLSDQGFEPTAEMLLLLKRL